MPQITVGELKKALRDVPDEVRVTFQGNEVDGEEDIALHTYETGYVFGAFLRQERKMSGIIREFVIDCAATNHE